MSTAITIFSEVRERYAHYEQVRFSSTLLPDGTSSWQIQGWNGKKWVRAKARKGVAKIPGKMLRETISLRDRVRKGYADVVL